MVYCLPNSIMHTNLIGNCILKQNTSHFPVIYMTYVTHKLELRVCSTLFECVNPLSPKNTILSSSKDLLLLLHGFAEGHKRLHTLRVVNNNNNNKKNTRYNLAKTQRWLQHKCCAYASSNMQKYSTASSTLMFYLQ